MTITNPRRLIAAAAAAAALTFGAQAATAPQAHAYIGVSKCFNALLGNNNTDNDVGKWLYYNVPGTTQQWNFYETWQWTANNIETHVWALSNGHYYYATFWCKDNGDGAIHSDEDFRTSYA